MREGSAADACEELGDILMLVFLTSEIAAAEQRFTLEDVACVVDEKLVRRHPHVFGDRKVADSDEVKRNWDEIKRGEGKRAEDDGLPSLSAALPALVQAARLGEAASAQGFDWPDRGGPLAKISEEWEELREAVARDDKARIDAEVGDLLFAVTSLCRVTGTDPEDALRAACRRFRRRFAAMARAGGPAVFTNLATMGALWAREKGKGGPHGDA